jgi:transposase
MVHSYRENQRMHYGPGSAWERPTTEAVRRAIQHSQARLRVLAKRYGINQKTVAKWKRRTSVGDLPTGPKGTKSTALSVEEETIIVAFRRPTLLPLDDCLYALQPTIPHLTRSSLHRCLQRHGISQLPQAEGEVSRKRKFKASRSAISILTSPKSELNRESSTSSWRSTGHRSSLSSSCTKRPPAALRLISSDT